MLRNLIEECNSVFDVRFLEGAHCPYDVGDWFPNEDEFPKGRYLNYLVRQPSESELSLEPDTECLRGVLGLLESTLQGLGIDIENRYTYVTIDQGWVEPGETQRSAGWHIDGLQGDEVPVQQVADAQIIWCDDVPTEWAFQEFDVRGLDVSKHNVFSWLDRQVKDYAVREVLPFGLTLHNAYLVHRCGTARERTHRRFMRVSFTKVPVTATTMTINGSLAYDYSVHTTSGGIPKNLV